MSCSPFDLKDYFFQELGGAERKEVEAHVHACQTCREELNRLRLTGTTLLSLREEEIPRRIGFVSDKVFEPHWWQRAFRLTFANPTFSAACVVAAAILVHAFVRSGDAVVQAQIDAAVTKAVAQVETRHAQERAEMLAASELMQKYATQMYVVSNGIVRQ